MTQTSSKAVFGKRREAHTIIIAKGNSVRHFTVRPWLVAVAGSVLAALAIGHLLSTAYLVLRDDLIAGAIAHQARMQYAYEDRISALRNQVDRITSRQLLDQKLMEDKVAELIERQERLTERHGQLRPLISNQVQSDTVPVPEPKPERQAVRDASEKQALSASAIRGWLSSAADSHEMSRADRSDMIFARINQALEGIEKEQINRIDALATDTYQTVAAVSEALEDAGLQIAVDYGQSDAGGPLISSAFQENFDVKVKELDIALERLELVKEKVQYLPISNPARGQAVSSSFGYRKDPILGRRAMHSGMDFRAKAGAEVHAAGAGVVVFVGWNGGYGRMVEIDHGQGYRTRYAHLRRITVKKGETVDASTIVGLVGSSGRSTGPHLHYEVRRKGRAVNPLQYLTLGRKISKLLGA